MPAATADAIQGIGPESWPLYFNGAAPNTSTAYWYDRNCGAGASAHGKGCQAFEEWYYAQSKDWNPKSFDPSSWIALMKRAGVKYFDFTAKHCEGFAMYETATVMHDCWDFDVTGQKPPGIKPCAGGPYHYSSHESFGRDIVGELITAARAGGILPGEPCIPHHLIRCVGLFIYLFSGLARLLLQGSTSRTPTG